MNKLWKATGARGSWFATIEGDDTSLPCVHQCWWEPGTTTYLDPFPIKEWSKIPAYVEALKSLRRAILTTDRVENGIPVERTGYVAEYAIDAVEWSEENGLTFRFTRRLRDLR